MRQSKKCPTPRLVWVPTADGVWDVEEVSYSSEELEGLRPASGQMDVPRDDATTPPRLRLVETKSRRP